MKLERLSEQNQKYYAAAKALYEEAFPVLERRDDTEQARIMQNPAYHFDFITDEDGFVGSMLYWETDSFVYLEHFAILPELRCKGKATAALGILEEQSQKTVILEIEPPCDDTSIRRYRFYQRSGFVMNPHEHLQAKYHLGDADLYLKILTYPREISKDEYAAFRKFVDAEVAVNDEIVVRPMQDCDDRMKVANLIYMTDKYIYPYWFDSAEDGAKVIAKMTSLPTLYNQKNITVAVAKDGRIAGVLVSCYSPVIENEEHIRKAFEEANVPCDERTHRIFSDYYAKMAEDKDGFYVANIAVDPQFRNKGVASKLITQTIKDKGTCHLECVIANQGAWKLYQKLGFRITGEYPGVFDVPCYTMVKD